MSGVWCGCAQRVCSGMLSYLHFAPTHACSFMSTFRWVRPDIPETCWFDVFPNVDRVKYSSSVFCCFRTFILASVVVFFCVVRLWTRKNKFKSLLSNSLLRIPCFRKVTAPLFVIHGTSDRMIDPIHGKVGTPHIALLHSWPAPGHSICSHAFLFLDAP